MFNLLSMDILYSIKNKIVINRKIVTEMKKVLIACLTLVMLVNISLSVFAQVGGFTQSPSANQAPTLIDSQNESEDCVSELIMTAYLNRDNLPEEICSIIEEVYDIIKTNTDLSVLNEELADMAEDLDIDVTDLAISDLFDISPTECPDHADHGHFDIVLESETLKNFVCLLHYYNNEWHIVEGAKVTNNGTHLEFDEKEFSPFAIVVNASAEKTETPETSDYSAIFVVTAVVSGIALVILVLVVKKIDLKFGR